VEGRDKREVKNDLSLLITHWQGRKISLNKKKMYVIVFLNRNKKRRIRVDLRNDPLLYASHIL
jgi:hypothetical protein